ncbi:hypothetical protein ZWY2020_036373 [Hordeum vulgare]|nr:hypothetical protein ZWY2020_036373 [Hordeum vulgare]
MLHVCIDGISKRVKDQHKFKWPVGNLSLIQYSYWEKVQPTGIDEPLSYEYPLILNWSEIKAKKRDEYDSENGRGHGKFDDVIVEDHREAKVAKEGTLPEVEAQTETSKRNGGASGVINIMKQIQKDVLTLPTKCAKEEKNNASFTNMPIDEELNDDTGARINGSGIGTPNDPFIVNGNNSPMRSSSSLPTNEFHKVTRAPENGGILILDDMQNDVSSMGSEATIDKLNEALFGNYAVMVSTEYLDAEHVDAANAYINTLIENGKHRKDVVVKIPAPDVDICTADMLGDIIKKKWLCGAVIINAYCKQIKKHSKVVTGRKTKMEILVKRTTTTTRVKDEYFNTHKAYFPMNVNGTHWITVLMHNTKKEFQVLDSLGPIDRNIRKTIHTLVSQIAIDIAAANKQVESKFPDVSAWPIVEYEMPKQTDGVSCGLFVLRCIVYWDGEKWTSTFDQDEINESRSKILVELIFSEDNIVEKVKHKVLRLISQD